MKRKILSLVLAVIAIVSLTSVAIIGFAEEDAGYPTGKWAPHNYVISGYQIPTTMSVDDETGAVTFAGDLNAGIATTGFAFDEPIDLADFSVDMDLNIPAIDNLTWLCFGFFDTNTATDNENPIPVYMPFNAFSGLNGYNNAVLHGGLMMINTGALLTESKLGISLIAKNIVEDTENAGTYFTWETIASANVILDGEWEEEGFNELTISSEESDNGYDFTINGKAVEFSASVDALADYFAENDCYFSAVMMYSDGNHREVEMRVNTINGNRASDGTPAAYLSDKTVINERISAVVSKAAIGNFGVYPRQIDTLKVTRYDDSDGDYETVTARASSLQMDIIDYFKVNPAAGSTNITLADGITVNYALPGGYSEYKVYYINDEDEAVQLTANIQKGIASFEVDNDTVTKVIVYGKSQVACDVSDWVPQNYLLSGYEIPTSMSVNATEGTVTFTGSLNAGIATTGFAYDKPVSLTNWSVDMDVNIPNVDKLSWLCLSFFDSNTATDSENDIAPVYMPFNAFSGLSGYQNTVLKGGVLMLFTDELISANKIKATFITKNIVPNDQDGYYAWRNLATAEIILDEEWDAEGDNNLRLLSIGADGGAVISINGKILNFGNNLSVMTEYFSDKDCYFSTVMMYGDGDHRSVTFTINTLNGQKACDSADISYLADKTITNQNISVSIPSASVGNFGIYPRQIDTLKVTKYDEEDANYEAVSARATSLGLEIMDYFKVIPAIGENNITLKGNITVSYTLPEGYGESKVYYINDEDEAVALTSTVNGRVVTFEVDNDSISKVIVYAKEVPIDEAGGCSCGSNVLSTFAMVSVLLVLAFAVCRLSYRKIKE